MSSGSDVYVVYSLGGVDKLSVLGGVDKLSVLGGVDKLSVLGGVDKLSVLGGLDKPSVLGGVDNQHLSVISYSHLVILPHTSLTCIRTLSCER